MSALSEAINEYVDKKLLRIRDWENLVLSIDKDFELTVTNDQPVILRKANRQIVPGSFENNLQDLIRANCDDRSFGKFLSEFTPRTPTPDEKGKVKAILDHERIVYKDADIKEKIETHVLQNFIPDGNKLRPLNKFGYLGDARSPMEIIQHYGADHINPLDTELQRLEWEAELSSHAFRLAQVDPAALSIAQVTQKTQAEVNATIGIRSKVDRIKGLLQQKYTPSFEAVPADLLEKQAKDIENRAYSHFNIFDKGKAKPEDVNGAKVKINVWNQELSTELPPWKNTI
jgi:hypothetical protein